MGQEDNYLFTIDLVGLNKAFFIPRYHLLRKLTIL